ncbi:Uncharacterized protein SCF082_LOCUS50563 [Durusdinium trenchii]|uniref:Uncharacterized protein n=1 Tax=Durusdinium trenchii TaxID=1381693 RepID=A0ABP0S8T8_9DINO
MAVRWTSDEEEVVLEVPDESGKSTVDSSRSPWRQLLEEMENAGVTDTSVNGHDLVASTMAPASGGTPNYLIKPKATPVYYQYNEVSSNCKYTNVASFFNADELDGSKTLTKLWRVAYLRAANESLQNCKPLYFFKQPLDLDAGSVIRLV